MKNKQVTIQEIIADIGSILEKIGDVLDDHEQRLQLIEKLNLKHEIKEMKCKIENMADSKKQAEALRLFKDLCDLLSIPELESTKS